MNIIKNFIAKKLGTKMAKMMFLAAFNAVGIISVLGIPVVELVDAIFIIIAIKGIVCGAYGFAKGSYEKVLPLVKKTLIILSLMLAILIIISIIMGIYDSIGFVE